MSTVAKNLQTSDFVSLACFMVIRLSSSNDMGFFRGGISLGFGITITLSEQKISEECGVVISEYIIELAYRKA